MKPFCLLLLTLLLAGCDKAQGPATPATTITDEQRAAWSQMAIDSQALWLAAIAPETNRAAILARYDEALNAAVIDLLARTDSRTALLGKLDSLERGANRHNYTKAQLEAALALKEQRAKARADGVLK